MKPDARLRMEVYQEGQRAYSSGATCPYTDWRQGTWHKGNQAAREWSEANRMAFNQPRPPQEMLSAGWTIRRAGRGIQVESPEGDGTTLSYRDIHDDVLRYFDDLLRENGL